VSPEEIAQAVQRANARLDSKPEFVLTCGGCGQCAPVSDDPDKAIYQCDQCGVRMAFGSAMPGIRAAAHVDRRFITITFEHGRGIQKVEVTFTLDRDYAHALACNLLGLYEPGRP
jgi:hypothetical protein